MPRYAISFYLLDNYKIFFNNQNAKCFLFHFKFFFFFVLSIVSIICLSMKNYVKSIFTISYRLIHFHFHIYFYIDDIYLIWLIRIKCFYLGNGILHSILNEKGKLAFQNFSSSDMRIFFLNCLPFVSNLYSGKIIHADIGYIVYLYFISI